MSYAKNLQHHKRRHPTKHLTGAEAIEQLNTIVDEANERIARAVSARDHWQQIAAELEAENAALRVRIEELEEQARALEVENQRLAKRARKSRKERAGPENFYQD